MALLMRSSVARSIGGGVPALCRASGPRASPSSAASPGSLAYHSRQAGYYTNGGAQKQISEIIKEERMAMKREEKIFRRLLLGFFALSGGYAIHSGISIGREIRKLVVMEREEAAAREEADRLSREIRKLIMEREEAAAREEADWLKGTWI